MAEPIVQPKLNNPNPGQDTQNRPVNFLYYIPHQVLNSTDENSDTFAVSVEEFKETVEYINQKIAEVGLRQTQAFSEEEAKEMLAKFIRIIPLMSDQKELLIQNQIVANEIEFENLKNTIVGLTQRPSIKNIGTFPDFRENLKNFTQTKTLKNGFESIESVVQDRQAIQQQAAQVTAETIAETATDQPTQETTGQSTGLKADFKIPSNIETGKEIKFTNNSSNAEAFTWVITKDNREVGRFRNTREVENFIFSEPGNYYISLNVSDGKSFDTATKLVTVTPAVGYVPPAVATAPAVTPPTAPAVATATVATPAGAEPDWDTLLSPANLQTLNAFQRQALIEEAVKAGQYDPLKFRDPQVTSRMSGMQRLANTEALVEQRERINAANQSETTAPAATVTAPVLAVPPVPSFISRTLSPEQIQEQETLQDLVKLSPLGRRAIWGTLNEKQRKHLTDNPFREGWQDDFDKIFNGKGFEDKKNEFLKKIVGYAFLRDSVRGTYNNFKEKGRQQLFDSSDRGNAVAKWTKKKYLEYKQDKNKKQSILKLVGFLGKEIVKTILSPITNAYDFVMNTKAVSSVIRVIQGANNFAGKSLTTIGRIGNGLGGAMRYAILPTIISSLVGVNPLLAAGVFSSLGLATQAFKGIDLLSKPGGFKLPFIDGGPIQRARIINELQLNPQRYADQTIVKFPKAYREIVNEFRTTPELARGGRLFSLGKHLMRSLPLGIAGAGLGFLLTGNLPLALLIGGGTIAARAGIGYAAERISMVLGRGLSSSPLYRHIFKLPGMSFLDAADGAQWIGDQTNFIKEKGWNEWFSKQGDTITKLGPVNYTEGMNSAFMLAKTGVAGHSIVRFFSGIPAAVSSTASAAGASASGSLLGKMLGKLPLISRIAAPAAVLGYLGAVALGLTAFSWGTFLGIVFGAIAGSLTFALLSGTILGALVSIPAAAIVGHYANRFGNWVGGFFDKTAEVINDMNLVNLIPIVQLGKAIYDIVNSTIEDLSDYARLGLISLSVIPAIGILIQMAENQASANFETANRTEATISSEVLNYEADNPVSFTLEKLDYDCNTSNQKVFLSEIEFKIIDIIALNTSNINTYNLKGETDKNTMITYKNMKNINPELRINQNIEVGKEMGSC